MAFRQKHLLGIEQLDPEEITALLDLADRYVDLNRRDVKHEDVLAGRTQINMFFENSTRTQASFEIAGKRLGADVMNMAMQASSVKKGETLIDTALTLNAMHPDLLVVRHPNSGAVNLLAEKVNCAVLNAGDGRHEHPTQALLDALTIRRAKGRLHRLNVAICGDIAHSRVARSNILLLGKMESRIRLVGPPTLMPAQVSDLGVEVYDDMREGLSGCDVVMMLRLQKERMDGGFIPSEREYYHRFGLDADKLSHAKEDAIVMHPGPMNRGVEIDGTLADDINRSVIQEQVEMGVAVRMAAMDLLGTEPRGRGGGVNERVRASETGVIRLYSVDLPPQNIRAFSFPPKDGPWALAEALGVEALNPRYAQVIYVADLEGVGLPEYLAEGEGLSEADLAPYLPALERLTGHVAVISSRAFEGREVTLTPKPPLAPILTLARERPATTMEPLESESAKGVVGAAGGRAAPNPRPRFPVWIIMAAILLIAVAAYLVSG